MKNVFTLFIIFLSTFPSLAQINFSFEEVEEMPEAVSNNAVTGYQNNGQNFLYSFTGMDESKDHAGIHLKTFKYDVLLNSWEQLMDVPDPNGGKIAAGASTVNGKIYLIGGYHVAADGTEISSAKTHIFDPITDQFLGDGMDIPVPIDDHVQAIYKDSLIFVVTGWSNTANVPDVQIYDTYLNTWTAGTSVPSNTNFQVFGASGTIIGDTIYYAGGARFANNFPATLYFRKGYIHPDDPSQIDWTQDLEILSRGYRMASFHLDGKAFWLGGSQITYNYDGIAYNGSGGVPPLDRILYYRPETGDLSETFGMIPPRMDLRGIAQISADQFLIAGGMIENQTVTNKSFIINYLGETNSTQHIKKQGEIDIKYLEDHVRIDFPTYGNYQIIDLNGRMVKRGNAYKNEKIDWSSWASGNYFVIFEGSNLILKAQIIKP